MKFDRLIIRNLWIGGVLLVVLLVAVVLWLGLSALGDVTGAAVLRGLAVLVFVCWFADFVALVVLLALARLNEKPAGSARIDEPSRD